MNDKIDSIIQELENKLYATKDQDIKISIEYVIKAIKQSVQDATPELFATENKLLLVISYWFPESAETDNGNYCEEYCVDLDKLIPPVTVEWTRKNYLLAAEHFDRLAAKCRDLADDPTNPDVPA